MTDGTCVVEDCGKPQYQRRVYCGSHFMRAYRYGDPLYSPPPKYDDKTGRRYGALMVMARVGDRWQCLCDCGAVKLVRTGDLVRGSTASCGGHWYKTTVTYAGAHDRVVLTRGRAKDYDCVDCGVQAHDWSYDHRDPDECTAPEGMGYSGKPEHYEPRCRRCHRIYDDHPFMARHRG